MPGVGEGEFEGDGRLEEEPAAGVGEEHWEGEREREEVGELDTLLLTVVHREGEREGVEVRTCSALVEGLPDTVMVTL